MHLPARPCLFLVLVLFAAPVHALRCGTDLVREGDAAFEVRRACGQPDWVSRHHSDYGLDTEIWHYNFGPNELLRVLHFRAGRLRRIETAGRGFIEPDPAGRCRPPHISRGMSARELLQRCGQPVQREGPYSKLIDGHVIPGHHGRHRGFQRVIVEDWYYEFGSGYLARRLRLVDGIVREIETLP